MKSNHWMLCIIVCLTTALSSPVWCDEHAPVSVAVQARPLEVLLGDVIDYRVEVLHDEGIELKEMWPEQQMGNFEILDSSPTVRGQAEQGKQSVAKGYSLIAFATGEQEIPGFEVSYLDANGVIQQVRSSALTVSVNSLIGSSTPSIRDIKPPVSIPFQMTAWVYWALGIVAVLIGTALLIGFWRRPAKGRELPASPPMPADVWARNELRKIRMSPLMRKKLPKPHAIAVSGVIRTYMEKRYGFAAVDMTTEEIESELKSIAFEEEVRGIFGEMFTLCDLIKFAKHQPHQGALEDILNEAEQFVDKTKAKDVPSSEDVASEEVSQ